MFNGTKYIWDNRRPEDVEGDDLEFAEIGDDMMESEELTNKIYEAYLSMIVKRWSAQERTKQEFHVSDIGLVYAIGPYIPCVKRVSYTRSIDIDVDGFPGIQVTAMTLPGDFAVNIIRPFDAPREVCFVGGKVKTYKYITMFKSEDDEMESLVLFFGINKKGYIIAPVEKLMRSRRPWMTHGATQLFPALDINSHFDSRNLWLANTFEDVGYGEGNPLRFRLGLSKEHIKSLFYARTLPVTETGRKRPILHWVRAHARRIKEGIDIDVTAHLRGITQFDMDGLNFEITQPDKAALHKAEPETVKEAFKRYSRSI